MYPWKWMALSLKFWRPVPTASSVVCTPWSTSLWFQHWLATLRGKKKSKMKRDSRKNCSPNSFQRIRFFWENVVAPHSSDTLPLVYALILQQGSDSFLASSTGAPCSHDTPTRLFGEGRAIAGNIWMFNQYMSIWCRLISHLLPCFVILVLKPFLKVL